MPTVDPAIVEGGSPLRGVGLPPLAARKRPRGEPRSLPADATRDAKCAHAGRRLEYTDNPDNPRTTAVDRRSTPSLGLTSGWTLPMFRCFGLPGFPDHLIRCVPKTVPLDPPPRRRGMADGAQVVVHAFC